MPFTKQNYLARACLSAHGALLTLLGLQSRFGDVVLRIRVNTNKEGGLQGKAHQPERWFQVPCIAAVNTLVLLILQNTTAVHRTIHSVDYYVYHSFILVRYERVGILVRNRIVHVAGVSGGLAGGPCVHQDQFRGFESYRVHSRRDFLLHEKMTSGKHESVS